MLDGWLAAERNEPATHSHALVQMVNCYPHSCYAGLGSPGNVWTHLTDIATLGGAYKGVRHACKC